VAREIIVSLGFAYNLFVLTGCFTVGSIFWWLIKLNPPSTEAPLLMQQRAEMQAEMGVSTPAGDEARSFPVRIVGFFKSFVAAIVIGAKLVCTNRTLVWLLPGYTLPLVIHRYLENSVVQFYAKFVLKDGSLAQLLVGGSNLGELIGAFVVFLLAAKIYSPLPWLRLDALCILAIWILPYAAPTATLSATAVAWRMFPVMSLVSFGWASGDVSLAAYVQARVSKMPVPAQNKHNISALGAVMAFLYVSYVVCFPIVGFLASLIMDHFNHPDVNDPQGAFFYIGGLVMTAAGVVIFMATFIPRGSFALNPRPEPMAEPKAEEPKAEAEEAQAPIALEPEDAQVGLEDE
jgi:hypothetical protein